MLAINKLKWGSQEALDFTDKLYEKINFYAIKASNQLAKEREAYPYFKGSDWETGAYFDLHEYTSPEWQELAKDVAEHGMRNGYLIAVAPNVSTAQIAGSTPSIDPVFDLFYYQENKKGRQPVIAPDLDYTTYEYYGTSAEKQDQFASIKQNAVRQKHIDQSQSFNLYIPNSISASTLLSLFTTAWETGTKTIYYTRSRDTDVEECVWCQ